MHALYHLQFFDDSNITEIFDQLISYQILLDLLYDRKMYGDVLRINDEIQRRIAAQNRYASSAMNAIIFATYYRLVRAQYIKHTYIMASCIFCTYITCTNTHTYIPPSLSPCHNIYDPRAKLCKFIQTHFQQHYYHHTNRIHRLMMNLPMTCTKCWNRVTNIPNNIEKVLP